MTDDLRKRIARAIARGRDGRQHDEVTAQAILDLPEIAEALRATRGE